MLVIVQNESAIVEVTSIFPFASKKIDGTTEYALLGETRDGKRTHLASYEAEQQLRSALNVVLLQVRSQLRKTGDARSVFLDLANV